MTFPSFEDWKAPWEAEGKELDPDTVKRLVYNLKKSESEHKEELGAKDEKIQERDDALKVYKEAEDKARREAETDAEKAARERVESEKAVADAKRENDLLRVQLKTGLTDTQIERLRGATYEELLADAEDFKKDLKPADEHEGETDEERAAREAKEAEEREAEEPEIAGDVLLRQPRRRRNDAGAVQIPEPDVRDVLDARGGGILAN